jgi:hypothetical protein
VQARVNSTGLATLTTAPWPFDQRVLVDGENVGDEVGSYVFPITPQIDLGY